MVARAAEQVQPPFAAGVQRDAETGWQLVVLRFSHPRAEDRSLTARIAPAAGGNLYSLAVGPDELLMQAPTLGELAEQRVGTPILFPTPNRVRDATFAFEGRTFSFEPNNHDNFIHGLVRKRPWQIGELRATRFGAMAEVFIDWDQDQPEFDRFPIEHRLTVTYTLKRQGLRIAYRVDNRDRQKLPFGFALHPYFRIPGAREAVFVEVPAAQRMEAVDLLPTGQLLKVAGTPYDLRKPISIETLNLDDVYFGMRPGRPAAFELRDRGLRVTLGGSKEFTHLVIFTPLGRPFFCLENQTSSTDAHNLWAAGKRRASHLLVVPPGGKATGHVEWTVGRIEAAPSP